jgi:hypothetical protein
MNAVVCAVSRRVIRKSVGATKSVLYWSLWRKETVGRVLKVTAVQRREAEDLPLLKAVTRQLLVMARWAGKDRVIGWSVEIFSVIVATCKWSINTISNPNPFYSHSIHVTALLLFIFCNTLLCLSSNASEFYSRGTRFESRSWYRLSWLMFPRISSVSSEKCWDSILN